MTKTLLLILFFTLPLIHGRIFDTIWVDIYFNVSGNFEFSKAIYFNILSSLIILSCFSSVIYHKRDLFIPWIVLPGFVILALSTLFSISPFTSLIWDLEKWHTALLFLNLLWLYTVLRNMSREFIKKLLYTVLISWVFVVMIAVKELLFATYDYWALSSRAFWSFWHPNYLAGYLLLLLPLTLHINSKLKKYTLIVVLIIWVVLTQSLVAVLLTIVYFGYLLYLRIDSLKVRQLSLFLTLWFTLLVFSSVIIYFPEKLHSFLSRFYIWETTLKIILSDIKIFLIWWWVETLPYYFDSFKVPEVYIFENYWFTADRPHSFLLQIFYSFWVAWLWIFFYFIYKFIKYFKNTPENIVLLLFLLFWIIHYYSITSYALLILVIALRLTDTQLSIYKQKDRYTYLIFIIIVTIASIVWAYHSAKLYKSEILYTQKKYIEASENTVHPKYLIKLSNYSNAENIENTVSQISFKSQIRFSPEKQSLCNELISNYPSAENYMYCWDIFWELWKIELAKQYYISGLAKLPDLWNDNSPYWDNYFIKNTITGNRFFSEKFWDIKWVLEKINDK